MNQEGPLDVVLFGDVEFNTSALTLHRSGEAVAVEPQVFDVLSYLIDHRDRVVSKEELLDNVWGDRFVSESALTSRVKSARQAVGDDGRRQEVIRTAHGRGYQFIAPIENSRRSHAAPSKSPAMAKRSTPGILAPPRELLGRDALVTELKDRLSAGTLVTLIGPAGVGKTHLARHLGASLHDRFPAGSWFVPLANLRDSAAVAEAVLGAIGVVRAPGSTAEQAVVANLVGLNGLLVLDNCEHVIEGASALVRAIREAGSEIAILTTTRQRLSVAGQRLIEVPVLASESAIALFVDRVAEHGTTIDPTSKIVESVCHRLDHLPLALELVGAYTRVLGIEQVEALLDERTRLFEDEGADERRHRTLDEAISASYELLDGDVQRTLCHFSVFAGSFDLAAATALAAADSESNSGSTSFRRVQHLNTLAERSLLVVEEGDSGVRYRLLESVRLFAAERLHDAEAVKSSHLHHFTTRAENYRERLKSGDWELAFNEVTLDWDNFRAAIGYGLASGEKDLVRRLLIATVDYADITQRVEHCGWSDSLLAVAPEYESIRGCLARLVHLQDLDRARKLIEGLDPADDLNVALTATWFSVYAADIERVNELFAILRNQVGGSGGIIELTIESYVAFLATALKLDPAESTGRMQDLTTGEGPMKTCYARSAKMFQAFADGENETAFRLAQQIIDQAEAYGLELLVIGCYRARDQAMMMLEDQSSVAGLLAEGVARFERQGHATAVLVTAPLVAKALHDGGRSESAALIMAVYNASGLVGSRSQGLADALSNLLRHESPAVAELMNGAPALEVADLSAFLRAELAELIDRGPPSNVSGTRR